MVLCGFAQSWIFEAEAENFDYDYKSLEASELRSFEVTYGGSFWRSLNFLSKAVVSWGIVPIDSNKQQKQNIKNDK